MGGETTGLVYPTRRGGYTDIDENNPENGHSGNGSKKDNIEQRVTRWKTIACLSITILVGYIAFTNYQPNESRGFHLRPKREEQRCLFCDQQSLPILHEDRSYTIKAAGVDDGEIVVTPMTVTYDYELYDGQIIDTNFDAELIPNHDFDYAILGLVGARNINRETGEPVSLDEVYLHHLTILPLNMLGAEVFTRDEATPPMRFPEGYALHVIAEESPDIHVNAHFLSNKNLAPIGGSIARAHKECNECYYAPGKGSDCTPEVSGTFACCGGSHVCQQGGEECACATNGPTDRSKTTKYQVQADMLISRDIDKLKRVEQWNFAAPACTVNLGGEAVFKEYPEDNACHNTSDLFLGGGSVFHHIAEDNVHPYVRTKINVVAPAGGTILFAQSHLHTGGVNATLRLNGNVICSNDATHGEDSDVATNARNERNHLIHIDACYDQIGDGVRFEAGDVFTTESFYYAGVDDDRFVGVGAAGEHKNVMSMFFTGVVFDGNADYLTKKRTSFNLWDNFVHIAGLKGNE